MRLPGITNPSMSSELFSFNYWVGFHSHIALFPSHPPPSNQPTITPQLFAPAEKKAKKNKKGAAAAAKGQPQKDGNATADGAEMVAMNPQGEERKPELEVLLLMRSVGRSVGRCATQSLSFYRCLVLVDHDAVISVTCHTSMSPARLGRLICSRSLDSTHYVTTHLLFCF